MILNIFELISFLYRLLKTKYLNKIGNRYFSQEGWVGGSVFDNGNINWCMLGGGIFVSNRAFLCRTMHFAIEPGFFMSNECYNARPSADMIDALCVGHFFYLQCNPQCCQKARNASQYRQCHSTGFKCQWKYWNTNNNISAVFGVHTPIGWNVPVQKQMHFIIHVNGKLPHKPGLVYVIYSRNPL